MATAPVDLQWEKHEKWSSLKITNTRAFIFSLKKFCVILFINPANPAPGVHTGHTLWDILRLIMVKHEKGS